MLWTPTIVLQCYKEVVVYLTSMSKNILNKFILLPADVSKNRSITDWVDPDHTLYSSAHDLGLYCLPTSNFQPVRLLDPDCCYKFAYLMANSADPDQLASEEANWPGSTLFAKQGISGLIRTGVKAYPLLSIPIFVWVNTVTKIILNYHFI